MCGQHQQQLEDRQQLISARRQSEKEQAIAEQELKKQRAEKRIAKRRAEQIEQLRITVLKYIVNDGSATEGIMS